RGDLVVEPDESRHHRNVSLSARQIAHDATSNGTAHAALEQDVTGPRIKYLECSVELPSKNEVARGCQDSTDHWLGGMVPPSYVTRRRIECREPAGRLSPWRADPSPSPLHSRHSRPSTCLHRRISPNIAASQLESTDRHAAIDDNQLTENVACSVRAQPD